MSTATTSARAWLARGDHDEDHAYRWWDCTRTALLPAGVLWDAIAVPEERAQAVIAAGLSGPVVVDRGIVYFLVPPGTVASWETDGSLALGHGLYVAVPDPEGEPPEQGPRWLQPPVGTHLVSATRLHALLDGGAR